MKLKDLLKYYIGSYPEWLITENTEKAFGAGIYNLRELVKKISIASTITTLTISTIILLLFIKYSIILSNIKLSTGLNILKSPIPLTEPYNYIIGLTTAILTYLTLTPALTNLILKTHLSYTNSVKKEKIDREMYNLLLTFLGFARGNLPILECIKEITKSDLGEEIRGEFTKIYNLVAHEGKSLRAALLEVALTTPSKQLGEFLRELAGVLEATRDITTYMENKLATANITRTIELNVYLDRLRSFSEFYLVISTTLSIMVTISGVFKLMSNPILSPEQIQILTMLAFPGLGLILSLLIHMASPEKEFKKKYGDIASALVGVIFAAIFLTILVNNYLNVDYRLQALFATAALSAIVAIPLERRIRFETGFDKENLQFLNRLAALLESRTLSRALQAINWEDYYFFRDHLKNLKVLASKGDPLNKVFEWSHKNSPTFMSSTISLILSKAVMSSSKLLEVVHNIIREFHNYDRYKKTRTSITHSIGGTILISFILVCAIMWLSVTTLYMPLSSLKATGTGSTGNAGGMSLQVSVQSLAGESRTLSLSVMMILLVVTPLCVVSIDGDLRKYFRYYFLLSIVAILFWILIVSGVNPINFSS